MWPRRRFWPVPSVSINPGIWLPRAADLSRSERLLACAGTCAGAAPAYVESAAVPRGRWRCPHQLELDALTVDSSALPGTTLDVLSPRTESSWDLTRRALKIAAALEHDGERAASLLAELESVARQALLSLCAPLGAFELASEVRFAHVEPNLETVTRDPSQGQRLLGLHADSHERRAISERAASQRLLSLNLSSSPRSLLFVNLQLSQIEALVDRTRVTPAELHNATDLGRAFLRQNRDYPVFRLILLPGEAYLAPVQNMVHDGSTLDMARRDLTLRAFGEFAVNQRSAAAS